MWREEGLTANSLLTRLLTDVDLGFVGDGDVFVQSNGQAGRIGASSTFPSFLGVQVSCGGQGDLEVNWFTRDNMAGKLYREEFLLVLIRSLRKCESFALCLFLL